MYGWYVTFEADVSSSLCVIFDGSNPSQIVGNEALHRCGSGALVNVLAVAAFLAVENETGGTSIRIIKAGYHIACASLTREISA